MVVDSIESIKVFFFWGRVGVVFSILEVFLFIWVRVFWIFLCSRCRRTFRVKKELGFVFELFLRKEIEE